MGHEKCGANVKNSRAFLENATLREIADLSPRIYAYACAAALDTSTAVTAAIVNRIK